MSYKAAAQMRPIFCILHLTADDTLASGDPVGWAVQDGTSGHGVTVASGVVTLPSGFQWFAQSQICCTSLTGVNLDWYVDGSASALFAECGVSLVTSPTTSGSNVVGHCYIDAASGSVDLELRADGAMTAEQETCFMLLIGYPS